MSLKDAYVEKMEAQLKQFSARYDHLKAQAQEKIADQKIKVEHKVAQGKEAGKAEYEVVVNKLHELKAAGDDKWESMKEHVEKAWAELTKTSEKRPPESRA